MLGKRVKVEPKRKYIFNWWTNLWFCIAWICILQDILFVLLVIIFKSFIHYKFDRSFDNSFDTSFNTSVYPPDSESTSPWPRPANPKSCSSFSFPDYNNDSAHHSADCRHHHASATRSHSHSYLSTKWKAPPNNKSWNTQRLLCMERSYSRNNLSWHSASDKTLELIKWMKDSKTGWKGRLEVNTNKIC